jgi:L-aminopeptidase/D-esterase-like protein
MKGGVGSASCYVAGGAIVGALAAVNSFGDVVDPRTGDFVAGARRPDGAGFVDTEVALLGGLPGVQQPLAHTTLGVVATDVALTKAQATKVAQMAHDGLARAIRPVHTPLDGDLVFALSLGDREGNVGVVGAVAARVLAQAVVRAVLKAKGLHGVPAVLEFE